VVEHDYRSAVARFYVTTALGRDTDVVLDVDAHHMRVLRLKPGVCVGLTDGRGLTAWGTLTRLGRGDAVVRVDAVREVAPRAAVHMLVPVGDRDRMLWLAEKCSELGATSWRPVRWHRSTSVSPHVMSPAFQAKVHARMVGGLTQSAGSWLPEEHGEASPRAAAAAAPAGRRILLDPSGPPLLALGPAPDGLAPPITIAVGPEGGLEDAERAEMVESGFVQASLGETILRFETAGVAALATVRAALSVAHDTRPGAAERRGNDGG
jgi:16S rRNA (uracil1498-N3)-methyltransferase